MVGLTRVRVVGLAVLALGAAAALVRVAPGSGAPGRPTPAPVTPPLFAAISSASPSDGSLELRSASTGGVLSVLGHLGRSWTSNGLALSPDGGNVYLTLIPKASRWKSLLLEQVSVSTHTRRFIGHGEQPSVSPDGRLLAYVSGEDRSATVVVRDRASGRRRSVNVGRLLGSQSDMLNASLAWLGDGTRLAVVEACCAIAASTTNARATDRSADDRLHLIVVSVPRHGSLRATQVVLPRTAALPDSIGTDAARPNSLLVSSLIGGDRAAVDRLTIGSSRATLARVLTIAHSLVVAFDPTGQGLLYLAGHSPPSLWTATLEDHRLSQRHLLIRNPPLDVYAW
jgi:hypothetical protein